MTSTLLVRLRSSLMELAHLFEACEKFAAFHGLPAEFVSTIELVLDEVVVNIIKHGYGGQAGHDIDVTLELQPNELVLCVSDDAPPFDPLQVPSPDLDAPLENRLCGGLGVHLVRSFMDDVQYEYQNGRNHLRMRKQITDRDSLMPAQ